MPALSPPSAIDLLASATDHTGDNPAGWLARTVAALGPTTAHLCRRPIPASDELLVGPMSRDGGGTPVGALCRATALPVRTDGLAGLAAVMCLPSVEPLDALLAELRRVLRPTGTLVALVPSRPGPVGVPAPVLWRTATRALRGHPGFRHEVARDHLAWLLSAADFALLDDQRRTFWLPVSDPDEAVRAAGILVPAGLWPPDVEPERLRRAEALLVGHARPGRRLPVALRMLLARR